MEQELKDLVTEMAHQCTNHADWLTFMRFGLDKLLQDQEFLLYLVTQEAQNADGDITQNVAAILNELGARIVVTPA